MVEKKQAFHRFSLWRVPKPRMFPHLVLPRFMCVIHESADVMKLMIIMVAVFIYLQTEK